MKRSLWIWAASAALVCGGLEARPADPAALDSSRGLPVPGADWVSFSTASAEAVTAEPVLEGGRGPAILLETLPTSVFRTGESVGLRLTHDPKGLKSAATLYLYRQNRVTGAREYYNLASRAFLPAGEQRDLFSATATPLPVALPKLDSFVLFGAGGALGPAVSVPASPSPSRLQFVLEVRDGQGKQVLGRGNAMYSIVSSVEEISGEITSNRTLTADKAYLLSGTVFVRGNATLTVEKGTTVFYKSGSTGALVIDRGSKILAEGTPMQPIVFTSDKPVGQRGFGDSGGLILNGRAPINIPGGEAPGEGQTGTYGGGASPNPDDSSGVLRYVRVEFAGYRFTPDNEFNGIAFQGVGRGTVVDHVQVHNSGDDAFEFFGGTVNGKYLIGTGAGDDNTDWVEGWTGKLQFVAVVQRATGDADTGIEADNKDTNNDLLPRSNPTIYNATYVGQPGQTGSNSRQGFVIRRGTAGKVLNTIVTGFREAVVAIRDNATFAQIAPGDLVIDNDIIDLNRGFANNGYETGAPGDQTRTFLEQTMKSNRFVSPQLTDPFEITQPDLKPLPGSPAWDARYVRTPPDDGFYDTNVNFVGAVGDTNWPREGWTAYPRS